ncbi:MAG: hypothetical protein QME60_09510, partial [Verrucomicrobiota bacterium]|nr:hypothetical protein [Verrucomicrobiota bacterium]
YFGDLTHNGIEDTDADGLSNALEYDIAADPTYGHDSDGDGLGDEAEAYFGTDPNWWDTDNDSMPDGWETKYGFDPKRPNDRDLDSDSDGWTDGREADYGTNPLEPDSDGDGVNDSVDADPLDSGNSETASSNNTAEITLTVGDSSGSHTELYLIRVGSFVLRMPRVTQTEYLFSRTYRTPLGKAYDGYVEALGDGDDDGDYDADVTGVGI